MRIKEIVSQHRRDFTAVYACGHCGAERKGPGYDDANYHENIVPAMACSKCGKAGEPDGYAPRTPRHPEGVRL